MKTKSKRAMWASAIGAVIVSLASSPFTPQIQKAWPSFTMVFEESGYGYGLNGAYGTQRTKLTYHSQADWRVDILSHSGVPDVAGTWGTYKKSLNGSSEVRMYDPRTGKESVYTTDDGNRIQLPAEWVRSTYVADLLKRPNSQIVTSSASVLPSVALGQAVKELVHTNRISCGESIDRKVAIPDISSCVLERLEQTRVIYREADDIPLEMVQSLDNVTLWRLTVVELTVQ
jgi:hypothetical protein